MKTAFLLLIAALLSSTSLLAEPTLGDVARQRVEKIKESAKKPGLNPEQAEQLVQMFLKYPITHVVIKGGSEKKEKTANIFIRGEEVYVSASDGWNLVANDSGVFEWEAGKKTGIRIKRDNEELLSYLAYSTDPSGIMSALYVGYRQTPDKFEVIERKEKGWTELRVVPSMYNLEAVYYSQNPFWLHGLRAKGKNGETVEVTVSKPQPVEAIPEEFLQQFRGIKFNDSDLSLKRHMVFL